MFELWKDDQSRVRLDENSQVSALLGSYPADRTEWSSISNGTVPLFQAQIAVHNSTLFIMLGTTDGQAISITSMVQGSGVKLVNMVATGRANVTLYAYGPRNVTASTSGLQFLDINGNVTFDSQAKWLRLAGRVKSPAQGVEYPTPSGVPTIAVGLSQQGIWLVPTQVGQNRSFLIMSQGIRVATNQVSIQPLARQGPLATVPGTSPPPPGDIFFADVTRY